MKRFLRLFLLIICVLPGLACQAAAGLLQTGGYQQTGLFGGGPARSFASWNPMGPTATPFQPLPTHVRYQAAETVLESLVTTPAEQVQNFQSLSTPRPTLLPVPKAEGRVNILLLGSDERPGGGFRTDIILLVSVNNTANTVSLMSFPRDLYVTIPGWGNDRINTAMVRGGFSLLAEVMQYNFGFRPDYYVMTNFNGFIETVDYLGGIPVRAAQALDDQCDLPDRDGAGYCHVPAGFSHMDGRTALWYVRSRHSSSDFDRTRRAQEVIQGIFEKVATRQGVQAIPRLYHVFSNNVETNLSLDTTLSMADLAGVLAEPGRVHHHMITPAMASSYITETGAWVLWPDFYAIQAEIQAMMGE